MAFKISTYNKNHITKYGEPYLYSSGDVTTSILNTSDNQYYLQNLSLSGTVDDSNKIAISKTGILINGTGGPTIAFKDSDQNLNNYSLTSITHSLYSFGNRVAINDKNFFITVKNTTYSNNNNTVAVYIHNNGDGTRGVIENYNLTPPTIKTSSPYVGVIADVKVYKDKLIIYHVSNNFNMYIYTTPLTISTSINENNYNEVQNTNAGTFSDFKSVRMEVANDRIVVTNCGSNGFSIYDMELNLIKLVTLPTNLPGMSINGGLDDEELKISVGCGRIIVSEPRWGKSASQGGNGATQGYVLVYDLDGNLMWYKSGGVNTTFGYSTIATNGRIYVSAPQDDGGLSLFYNGVIYEYDLDGNFIGKVVATSGGDNFGQAMRSDGNILLMSKQNEVKLIKLSPKIYTAYDKIYNEV